MRFKLIYDGSRIGKPGDVSEFVPWYKARIVDADTGEPIAFRSYRFEGGPGHEFPTLTLELVDFEVEIVADEGQAARDAYRPESA